MPVNYLGQAEQEQLNELRLNNPFADEVFRHLDRILASTRFERLHEKAKDFLRYIVAKTLLGKGGEIKETTIALAVFHESADFNPLETSKVRVAGADLRQRLALYLDDEGKRDPIEITIPEGTYVPTLRDRRASVAVGPFDNWHPTHDQDHLSAAITDDLIYLLNQTSHILAARATATRTFTYSIRGSFLLKGDRLRVNVSLANLATGQIVCWQDVEEQRDNVLRLTREVADILASALQREMNAQAAVAVRSRKRP